MSVILTMFPFVLSTKNKYPSEVIEKIIFSEIIGLNSDLIFCIQLIKPELESIEKKVLLLLELIREKTLLIELAKTLEWLDLKVIGKL